MQANDSTSAERPFGFRIARMGNGVPDLELAAPCYEALGFQASPPYDLGTAISVQSETPGVPLVIQTLRKDWLTLELCQAGSPRAAGPPQRRPMNLLGLTHLGLFTTDLQRDLEIICRHGGTRFDFAIEGAADSGLGVDVAFCADPGGTRLLLVGSADGTQAEAQIPGTASKTGGVAVAHVGACVADLTQTLDFYRALGFVCSEPTAMGTAFSRVAELDGVPLRTATAEMDGYLLWLLEWGGPRDPGVPVRLPLNRSGLIHFGTHCDDFDAMLDLVTGSGGTLVERTRGIFPPPGLTAPGMNEPHGWIFTLDPNGLQIEVVGPMRETTEHRSC